MTAKDLIAVLLEIGGDRDVVIEDCDEGCLLDITAVKRTEDFVILSGGFYDSRIDDSRCDSVGRGTPDMEALEFTPPD